MDGKFLGKIQECRFGSGGYQDVQFGATFVLETSGGCCVTGMYEWNPEEIEVTEYTQWTEVDRSNNFDKIMRFLAKIMNEAKVSDFSKLKGTPIEAEFKGGSLNSWRILKEVI